MDIQQKEGSLEDLVEFIISSPETLQDKSIMMNLRPKEGEYPENISLQETIIEQFNIFINIVTLAFRYMYGDDNGHVRISTITPTGIQKLQNRLRCLGFTFILYPLEDYDHRCTSIEYDKEDITKCHLVLWDREGERAFMVKMVYV